MGYPIQQSTASQPLLFWLIASSDHIAGLTGKAGSVVVTLSKNGAAFAAPAGAISEVGNGLYAVAGNATDGGTLGPLALHAKDAASDPFDDVFPVVGYNPLAATNLGLTDLDATISSRSTFAGGAVASVTGAVGSVTGPVTLADNSVTSAKFAVGATIPRVTLADTVTTYTGNTLQTGDSFARIGANGAGLTAVAIAPTGLDAVAVTTPSGPPTTFTQMVVMTYRRFFKKSTLTSTQLKCYADDGSTAITTQAVSDDGTTQTQGSD